MSKKVYDDDDGRTIVDMYVEGMPDYTSSFSLYRRQRKKMKQKEVQQPEAELTKKELFRSICSATLAALAVVGVFAVGLILFTLFCTNIWFS